MNYALKIPGDRRITVHPYPERKLNEVIGMLHFAAEDIAAKNPELTLTQLVAELHRYKKQGRLRTSADSIDRYAVSVLLTRGLISIATWYPITRVLEEEA